MTTIAQALEQVTAVIDRHIEQQVADYGIILRDHDATDDELATELELMRADCFEEKAGVLNQVHAWMNACRLEL
jgi:hypothetical protein